MKSLLLAITLAVTFSAVAAEKPYSEDFTGTVVTPKTVKDYAALTLEVRLYEYHPFIADKKSGVRVDALTVSQCEQIFPDFDGFRFLFCPTHT